MNASEFVHLHLHTEFSLLDGACRIDELLDAAAAFNMPAIAVTEHGNMFSAVTFHDHARARGIKPILGCEVYVAPESRHKKGGPIGEAAYHLVLLAENAAGYHNLIKLVSAAYLEGFYYRPRIDRDLLAAHADGLIGLSSCLKGEVASSVRAGQEERALDAAAAYRDILGEGQFFLELQYQGLDEQRLVNSTLPLIGRRLNLPLVCTNDVHYLRREDSQPHDILLCIGTGKTVNDQERLRYFGDQFYLKSPEEMAGVFADFPDALANTLRIAERCNVVLPEGENFLPNFDVPPPYTIDSYFEVQVRQGYEERLPRLRELEAHGRLRHPLADYERRLEYEIEMIKRMRYAGYFLIVWDFIRYARERGIPVGPGRGSAAGSLVAYCLRIADIDPLEHDLIFERFLNPERVSLPDIDIDFCEQRRGEVIEYVTRKYGRENVAQIITFGTMKARAVVRDVGRSLDIPYADVDRVAKQIPAAPDMTLARALEENPQLRDLEQGDVRVKELLRIARRLEGMTRHASLHAAGVVIAPRPLTEFVPLYKGQRDEITTQYAMKEIERIGLLKMDFLGLSTLTLLRDAVDKIRGQTGEAIDLDRLPLDDPKTYQLFSDGQTFGVFQFESAGMREILRKFKPQRFEDLVALNALYRPGPIRSGMIDDFINRKHGRVEIRYELPQLEPILRDTYGVIAYQEQVMRIASELAGFSLGQADILRKAMGKKNPKVMQEQRDRFVAGAVARKIGEKKANKIFDLMEHFAGYGFNKSHSAAYALLAYQTAYLKANYPVFFMASLLTIEAQNADKLALYLGQCRDMGIPVLPPDVNASALDFTVPGDAVRFGLGAVKNVGENAVRAVLAARETLGTIGSIDELCEQADLRIVNKRVLESLVKAGAFDSLGGHRAQWYATIDRALDHGGKRQRDRDQGQPDLLGVLEGPDETTRARVLPACTPWTEAQLLSHEKEALGFFLSGHPLARYTAELRDLGTVTTAELAQAGDVVGEVAVAGIIAACRHLKTKRGDRMAVCTLDDLHGSIDVVIFPETFARAQAIIETDRIVIARGKAERDEETARLLASEVISLDDARQRGAREIAVHLSAPPHGRPTLEALAALVEQHAGDRRLAFILEIRDGDRPFRVKADAGAVFRVKPSSALFAEIERICGPGSVSINGRKLS